MTIPHTFALALAAALALPALPSFAATEALPAGALRVQRAEIIDRRGFEKPLVAATMMVPAGWRQQGTVEWKVSQQKRCGSPHGLRLAAAAPDGSAAIELVPGDAWASNNFGAPVNDCLSAQVRDARQYLEAWVQQHRPGARWLDYRARPDKLQGVAGRQENFNGGGTSLRYDSGQALIAYNTNGREMRETLVANIAVIETQFQGLQGRKMQTMQGQSFGVLAWRASAGTLDFRQFDAVWATLRPGDEWQARMSKSQAEMAADDERTRRELNRINGEMQRENAMHAAQRHAIRMGTIRDVAAIRNSTYQSTQATNDRMHTDSSRTLREVNGYREPRGGSVVELSSHYQHAWQLRDGSYVLTDSPNFDPSRDLGIAGEQLARTR